MSGMDWSGLGVLAGLFVACVGYLSRQIHREVDGVRAEMREQILPRLDRLDERYIRHLEQHAHS